MKIAIFFSPVILNSNDFLLKHFSVWTFIIKSGKISILKNNHLYSARNLCVMVGSLSIAPSVENKVLSPGLLSGHQQLWARSWILLNWFSCRALLELTTKPPKIFIVINKPLVSSSQSEAGFWDKHLVFFLAHIEILPLMWKVIISVMRSIWKWVMFFIFSSGNL